MKIELKKIKNDPIAYSEMRKKYCNEYSENGTLTFDISEIENMSENVFILGEKVYIEIDEIELERIANSDEDTYKKNAEISSMLVNAFYLNEKCLPTNLVYDSNLWTYLNTVYFSKYIKKIYFQVKPKNPIDKVERYFFNIASRSKLSRTGFRFLWYMGMCLNIKEHKERSVVAYEFIDSVKAIFERHLSNNYQILQAYVDGIIKNGKTTEFKSVKNRSTVPSHINCFAAATMLDAYEYNELVNVIAMEQSKALIYTKLTA